MTGIFWKKNEDEMLIRTTHHQLFCEFISNSKGIIGPDYILGLGRESLRMIGPILWFVFIWSRLNVKIVPLARVLAKISKMPVQNSNFKISARPDLATNLLQILIYQLQLIS